MLILKHLVDWSYDDLEREVRANLVYRAFTRIDAGEVPDAKTILKIARALGPEVIEQLHRQVIEVAKRAGVTRTSCRGRERKGCLPVSPWKGPRCARTSMTTPLSMGRSWKTATS
jgi:Transposase domain (DUF772)